MATTAYIRGRWGLQGLRMRPQAILWSDNFGTIDSSSASFALSVPDEIGRAHV